MSYDPQPTMLISKPASERLILGVGVFAHDTAAALVRGGKVLFAAEQERFDRVKHSKAYPLDAVAAGLKEIGATFADIDAIAVNYDRYRVVTGFLRHIWQYWPRTIPMLFDRQRLGAMGHTRSWTTAFRERFGSTPALERPFYIPHHLTHAASAFYRSGLEQAAVLTSDAQGEFDAALFGHGSGANLEKTGEVRYPHSLGALYSAVTDHLGYKIFGGEGTVMGLAAYGRDRPEWRFDSIVRSGETENTLDLRFFRFHVLPWVHQGWVSSKFTRAFGPAREPSEPLAQRHADLARALQAVHDEGILRLAARAKVLSGSRNLVFAGGSALNGYSNAALLKNGGFDRVFFQPAANDGGTAMGAALFHACQHLGLSPEFPDPHSFLGPDFQESEAVRAFAEAGIPFERPDDLPLMVSQRLAAGRVVGWCQGRMELGPRALGHRSILAAPFSRAMRDRINGKIKRREPFRPFAPAVPVESASEYFVMPVPELPYMLVIVDVRSEWRERLAAITHVDGTSRVQTVESRVDPLFHRLLTEFGRQTGTPVLLNTSFNGPDEPIVNTPREAMRTARTIGLDDVAIGPFLARLRPEGQMAGGGPNRL